MLGANPATQRNNLGKDEPRFAYQGGGSDPTVFHGPLTLRLAGVAGRLRLEQQQVDLLSGDRFMLNPSGDHRQLSRLEPKIPIPQLDLQLSRL